MTYEEQLNWIDSRMRRNPDWADTEFEIRRSAIRALNDVLFQKGPVKLSVLRRDPGSPYMFASVDVLVDPARIGGPEQILLVEEQIRRAMYGK